MLIKIINPFKSHHNASKLIPKKEKKDQFTLSLRCSIDNTNQSCIIYRNNIVVVSINRQLCSQ